MTLHELGDRQAASASSYEATDGSDSDSESTKSSWMLVRPASSFPASRAMLGKQEKQPRRPDGTPVYGP